MIHMEELIRKIDSPMGRITMSGTHEGLTGLWLEGQRFLSPTVSQGLNEGMLPVFEETECWLHTYFSGREPDFMPKLIPQGSEFRQSVWKILLQIPYGKTTTYGAIAAEIAKQRGIPRMSAQAVGGAVGHNPISILIPCHRVLGSDMSLTGYDGGVDKKVQLLKLEGIYREEWI